MRRRAHAVLGAVVLFVPAAAHAREAPSLHGEVSAAHAHDDEAEEEEAEALDELGPRGNMRTRANDISFDARLRTIELSGNVRIDAPPFHLRSEHIRLSRVRYGIEIDGKGTLAFCPCLGTPLRVDF